jgi:hypothetical protein
MLPIYRYFGGEHEKTDYSEESVLEMFLWESYGLGELKIGLFNQGKINGYAVGKHWMDVTVKMWREDIRKGSLVKEELYDEFPNWHWWLDRVLN